MKRVRLAAAVIGVALLGYSTAAAIGAETKKDPIFVWPKNSQFICSGILIQDEGMYQLKPDKGMLTWCDADIEDKDKGRVLDACTVGDTCEIRGTIRGHGAFGWVTITSVRLLKQEKSGDRDASPCSSNGLPQQVAGLCKTPLFKSYTACVDNIIPNWDPKGPILSKQPNFPLASAVLAVLLECEPIARRFGQKYGNEFARILQSVANKEVSRRYGTVPLIEPTGDSSKFLRYGERVDPTDVRRGDLNDDRFKGFRRPVVKATTHVTDPLIDGPSSPQQKRACRLEIDGSNSPCVVAWRITFNNGGVAVQFNKQTGEHTMVSFFGKDRDADTIDITDLIIKSENQSEETKVAGQCILGKNEARCQARISDGRLVIGTVFLQ